MIHKVISAFWVFLIIVGLSGCQPESPLRPKTTGLPMKAGRDFWPGNFWVDIAHKKGWFKDAGLNVEMADYKADFLQSIQDWVDGKIDVAQPVFFDFIKYKAQGADLVVVAVADLSFGGDRIVARKGIKGIKDLKGKRIGLERGTFTEFMLSEALARNGMKLEDVEIVENKLRNFQPLIDGKLDAMITDQAFPKEVDKLGMGHKIFDSSEIPGLISDVMGFHGSFISERPEDVQAYVNVWHKTTTFIKENPKEAFGIISDIYKKPIGEVQAFAQVDKILDLRDNIVAFSYGAGFESLHGAARRINDFLIEAGTVKEELDSMEFLDDRFINALNRNSR